MKALKIILIAVLAIVILVFGSALFVNGEYSVEKSVDINRAKADVFGYLLLLENQDNFSVWQKMDPEMKKEHTGVDGTVGFISAWESNNKDVGKGEQEIKDITDGERIDYEIRFLEPFKSTDYAFIKTESLNDSTTVVTWGFWGEMKYPMNLMMLFMDMEGQLGPDLQNGLENLKVILESPTAEAPVMN